MSENIQVAEKDANLTKETASMEEIYPNPALPSDELASVEISESFNLENRQQTKPNGERNKPLDLSTECDASTSEQRPDSSTDYGREATSEPMPEARSEPMPEARSEPMPEAPSEPMPEATTENSDKDVNGIIEIIHKEMNYLKLDEKEATVSASGKKGRNPSTPRARSTPIKILTSPPLTRSRSREMRKFPSTPASPAKKGSLNDEDEIKGLRGRQRTKKNN